MRSSKPARQPSRRNLLQDPHLCQGRQGRLLLPKRGEVQVAVRDVRLQREANLDDGPWPTSFALKGLTAAEEDRDRRTREESGELRTRCGAERPDRGDQVTPGSTAVGAPPTGGGIRADLSSSSAARRAEEKSAEIRTTADTRGEIRYTSTPRNGGTSLPKRAQPAKYFAASSSIVPLVRIVVEPSRLSIDLEFSAESLMPPLGSQ